MAKRNKWPDVKELWFVLPDGQLTPGGTRVAFRYLGQQSAPDVFGFTDSNGVDYCRLAGFWLSPFDNWGKGWDGKTMLRVTDPKQQARLDVEYELSQGREVPPEVLADPWLFPPPWGSTYIVTRYQEAVS